MGKFCYSCGIPISDEVSGNFCQNCTDETGSLKPREEVQQGLAGWLASFSPAEGSVDFMARAAKYMEAMPAWND